MARRLLRAVAGAGAGAGARRAAIVGLAVALLVVAILELANVPAPNDCKMTYMYPTYIPLTSPANLTTKYGLFLYHEGWQRIDFEMHLLKLSGVPVLFIPGNGGSYKQVRSIAAESDRAFHRGPLEQTFFKEAILTPAEAGLKESGFSGNSLFQPAMDPKESYANHLDWFAVDLDGEHSAMDGRILEEHTEYVVQAVDMILDRYQESITSRSESGNGGPETPPKTVILVGHSMGGFVARAAVVHPLLRKGSVETVVTLSSPHRLPPVALQPSLGHFFSRVNGAWRKGYSLPRTRSLQLKVDAVPSLSKVIAVSIYGGTRDTQVRANVASLEGIVPATNGLTIGAPEIVNVWLSMEHQTILWCNQLVVQVAHSLLNLIDAESKQPVPDPFLRLQIFVSKLRSPLSQTLGWIPFGASHKSVTGAGAISRDTGMRLEEILSRKRNNAENALSWEQSTSDWQSSTSKDTSPAKETYFACPKSIQWMVESQEKDLYIESPMVTVLAMDGRRRWLDIQKMASGGRDWFAMVTNLAPCAGVRLHLWPERGNGEEAVSSRVKEVTLKFVELRAGPAPPQIEPGGQSEQGPPSAMINLLPEDLRGFHYLTISVAPQQTLSGRPPPATSMAIGQFMNVLNGSAAISSWWMLSSTYKKREVALRENHALISRISIAASLGIFPLSVALKTTGCGMREPPQSEGDHANICKLRCFPPVALVWDASSGLSVFPSIFSETISTDSSPAIWTSKTTKGTNLVLVADPHCAYSISMKMSLAAAACRFFLTYWLEVVDELFHRFGHVRSHLGAAAGFTVAILLFALMRQSHAWEVNVAVPSISACAESNLVDPLSFITLCVGPLLAYLIGSIVQGERLPHVLILLLTSVTCYAFASAAMLVLALVTSLMLYASAFLHVFLKARLVTWQERQNVQGLHRLLGQLSLCSSLQVVRKIRAKPTLTVAVVATVMVFFVHPALGLIVLSFTHGWRCHCALFRHRTHAPGNKWREGQASMNGSTVAASANPPASADTDACLSSAQLDLFNYNQGLLLLHMCATSLMMPSLVAWVQRPGWDRALPSLLDSVLSCGLIFHGLYGSSANGYIIDTIPLPPFVGSSVTEIGFSAIYFIAGVYCYWASIKLVPFKAFHALTMLGLLTAACRIRDRIRGTGEHVGKRRHCRKHRQL